MHEISLIQNLLASVLQEIETNHYSRTNIKGLALTVGALELHSEDAFRQAFAIESKGTDLEGASLELTIMPPIVQCPKCGFNDALSADKADPHNPDPVVQCPVCGLPIAVTGGRGVQQIELILDD